MPDSGGRHVAMRIGGGLALVFLALFLARAFTGEREEGPPAVQIWDSAGVEVVESYRPSWQGEEGWTIASRPLLRIGVVEGDPAYQFSGIVGAARLEDGTVVVADQGAQEVRFFEPSGEVKAVVGGRGGGPEEFTGLSGLGWSPDGGVWAYDFSLRRVVWMDPSGALTHLTSLGPDPPVLNPIGALPDGSFVLKQLWGYTALAEAVHQGFRRDPVAFVRFSPEGALLDTLGLFPGREVYISSEEGRGVMSAPPFARNATGAVRRGRVVVGSQETFSLKELDGAGELLRIVRIPGGVRPVGPGDLEAYIQGRLASAPPERHPAIRRSLEDMPVPETLPAYGQILGDRAGNLWVGEWVMYPDMASRWTVFDDGGRWLGEVRMPEGFHPWDVGEDWILGTERDELDVEYVVLYPLEGSR